MPPPERRLALAAGLGLAFVLAVVLASAAIRLGSAFAILGDFELKILRGIHRASASLELVAALALAWLAWRGRRTHPRLVYGAAIALAVTAFLSVLGIVAGRNPPAWAALGNLLGGLLLTATFGWVLAAVRGEPSRPFRVVLATVGVLLAVQCVVGARISVLSLKAPSLQIHALLGIGLAAVLAWWGGREGATGLRILAFLVPLAGFTALQYDHSAIAAFAHAAVAALLVAAVSFRLSRIA